MKKVVAFITLALFTAFLVGCSFDEEGTYTIDTVELHNHTLNINNFENIRNSQMEFRLESSGRATASYIIFTDHAGDKNYHADLKNSVTSYRMSGNQVILGIFEGVGTMRIEIPENGWLILTYKIENQLVYTAKYRK